MDIERIGKPNPAAGIPIVGFAAVHGGTVYVCDVTANPTGPLGDVKQQTREVLGQIDALLHAAGTSKSRLLTAQVWLTDMNDFSETTTLGTSGSIRASAGSSMRALTSAVATRPASRDHGYSGNVILASKASPP